MVGQNSTHVKIASLRNCNKAAKAVPMAFMDAAFLLKKLLTFFVTPTGFVLSLLIVAFLAIPSGKVRRLKKKSEGEEQEKDSAQDAPVETERGRNFGGLACFLVAAAIFTLYGLSIQPVSSAIVGIVEGKVPREVKFPQGFVPKYIVILPSGVRDDSLPATSRLSYVTLARIHGGLRYWREFPEATLVFSGNEEETAAMKEAVFLAGVPKDLVFEETEARDTRGHVVYLKSLLDGEPFLLVTSAVHYPRSIALFQGEGLEPFGVPVDFITGDAGGYDVELQHFIPKAKFLHQSERAFHEIVGTIWAHLRGQLD